MIMFGKTGFLRKESKELDSVIEFDLPSFATGIRVTIGKSGDNYYEFCFDKEKKVWHRAGSTGFVAAQNRAEMIEFRNGGLERKEQELLGEQIIADGDEEATASVAKKMEALEAIRVKLDKLLSEENKSHGISLEQVKKVLLTHWSTLYPKKDKSEKTDEEKAAAEEKRVKHQLKQKEAAEERAAKKIWWSLKAAENAAEWQEHCKNREKDSTDWRSEPKGGDKGRGKGSSDRSWGQDMPQGY
jgi:hypothetical protein